MPNHKSKKTVFKILILISVLIAGQMPVYAFPRDFYASSSALSEGNWAKIEVTETGMQFLSESTLNALGFSDPENVNIYGYGGRVIPENLDSPDDLPLVPSMRVAGGILFFGHGNVRWLESAGAQVKYSHSSHPYSSHSYYFLSDRNGARVNVETANRLANAGGEAITVYTERLLHEQDLSMAMNTGRLMLGEDFKNTSSRTFDFELPGNTGDAVVTTAFACKPTSGTPSLTFNANGKQLPASQNDRMPYSSTKLIVTTKTVKEVASPGNTLSLKINFNGADNVSKAALDYIEVEYPRMLSIQNGELYFYLNPSRNSEVRIQGATQDTRLWDVTDPSTPQEIQANLAGATLTFTAAEGYHEYVAFEPSLIKRGVASAGKILNQDIHGMEAPGMLVISPNEYKEAANRLITLHQQTDGLKVTVLTPEEIYNEFSSGVPDVSAFRKLLKMWYDKASGREGEYTEYCLIMSRPTYDNKFVSTVVRNAGYPRVPIWQSESGETATTSFSTDDYIGMLEDVTGTFNISNATIHVAVGRMPVKSVVEANTAMDKLETYLLSPQFGAWRNNIMVIADDQDNGTHLEQAEEVIKRMKENGNGSDFLYEKLYLDAYQLEYSGIGASYPVAKERMMNKIDEGVAFIDYIGHANPTSWGHEHLLTWSDINNLNNPRLPFIYAATCEFMRWDDDDLSGAEILWLKPEAGVIGMICPSREVLITANGLLNIATARYMFLRDEEGRPLPMGKIMILGKNNSNTAGNKLRYALMGDPSMRMPRAELSVKVDEIGGVELAGAKDLPVVQARSKTDVSGHITDREGNLLTDFNGILELQLYDAEKVITTNGNGDEGVESIYNDRKTRLFTGRVKVADGKWSTTINMPAEIENNYSPALISLYAYDNSGREANGACEDLYIYGYDQTAPDDFEGPKIIEFYVNNPSFRNGQDVSPNPIITARFSDESGISVSEAGMGHSITLELDGKLFYDDVARYYMADENDPTAGSITYQLHDIENGNHTLRLIVWDNANNSSSATIEFKISPLWKPSIETLATDVNPATTGVNFIVATDGTSEAMSCMIDVFDINGRKVWSGNTNAFRSSDSRATLAWNLNDYGGGRVRPGIYLYRATVVTSSGARVMRSRKLIVAGN